MTLISLEHVADLIEVSFIPEVNFAFHCTITEYRALKLQSKMRVKKDLTLLIITESQNEHKKDDQSESSLFSCTLC